MYNSHDTAVVCQVAVEVVPRSSESPSHLILRFNHHLFLCCTDQIIIRAVTPVTIRPPAKSAHHSYLVQVV